MTLRLKVISGKKFNIKIRRAKNKIIVNYLLHYIV